MLRRGLALTGQLGPVLLLIFCGWGLRDLKSFFANPARSALIATVLLGFFGVLILQLNIAPLRKGREPVGNQSAVLLALALASIALLWLLPFADRRRIFVLWGGQAVRYVGSLMCFAGVIVRLLALEELKGQFSAYVTLQDGHRLVQTGIYRYSRHPLYLSLLLAAPGFALVFASYLALPIFLAAVIFVYRRVWQEETLLERHFETAFLEYKNRTWVLIPLVI